MSSKYLSAGLIFIATVIIGVILVYPKYQSFWASGQAVQDKQNELDAQAALINEINKTKSKYKKAEDDLLSVADLLPAYDQKSVANLFVELENIASESGALIQTINFGATAQKNEKSAKGYKTVDVKLSIISSYSAFKQFAMAIENDQHLMDIIETSVSKGAAQQKPDGAKGDSNTTTEPPAETKPEDAVFNYSVSLNAYYQ